jgi:acetyl esterase/lipase
MPEIGAYLFLLALPAGLWLARKSPKFSFAFLVLLAVLGLYPWFSALGVARVLPAGMARAFGETTADRFPLLLAESEATTMATEAYKSKLKWDRYRPLDGEVRARILFVHGGSWRNGTRDEWMEMIRYLAGRGYEVCSLTYRLAPENPYPAAPQDIDAAIARLSSDGTGLPLFLMGRSSGGHLALLAAYRNPSRVAGVIAFYPPVDMVWSWNNPSNPAVLNSAEALAQFLGGSPAERPRIYREASPILEATESGPATLLIHGGRDSLVYQKQSRMLCATLSRKHVAHYLLALPWMEHGGDITIYGPSGRLSAWAIECFLHSQLGR